MVDPLNSLVRLILFLAISFLGFAQYSQADIIVPGPHKAEKRLEGTLTANSVAISLNADKQSYKLYFGSNAQLQDLAQKLIGKRVIVRGYPMAYRSETGDSDIEVASIVEAR